MVQVCDALSAFTKQWKRKFAGGSKAATVVCVGDLGQDSLEGAQVEREALKPVEIMDVLGVRLERLLTLKPLWRHASCQTY